MSGKRMLLKSLVRLLELVLPQRTAQEQSPHEAALDEPMQLAVRVVLTWAQVNHVPMPREWVVFSAEHCPAGSSQMGSEIHWAIKTLFNRIREDHAALLDERYRFKLELAVATASRAWYMIEEKDESEEVDSALVVDAYAGMFDPAASEPA
jgi:hypothetical protein